MSAIGLEVGIVVGAFALVAGGLALGGRRTWSLGLALFLAIAVFAWGAEAWQAEWRERREDEAIREGFAPLVVSEGGYVSSDACRSCHPDQYATWFRSHHRSMTQRPAPGAVLAPFDGRLLSDRGHVHRVEEADGRYWVRTDGGPRREVALLTGSHHQQRYWLRGEGGRSVELFPMAYLVEGDRWVPGDSLFVQPPGMTVVGAEGLWNRNCVGCHTVAPRPRIDAVTGVADTTVGELGIGCEACHGPGAEHVRANRLPVRRYREHLSDEPDPTIVNPARLSARQSSEICGQCHGVHVFKDARAWRRDGAAYRPGGELGTDRFLMRVADGPEGFQALGLPTPPPGYLAERFWPDGMVRVSGRELSGLQRTPCYQEGDLSCLSCHRMHGADVDDQLAPGKEGDGACRPCHVTQITAGPAHTHHRPDSSGSRCASCHMPPTTFGLLKAIRSHRISSPTVLESTSVGRPNACNLCHLDRTLAWTSDWLAEWYGVPPVDLDEEERTLAASVRWALRGDAGQRALVAWSFAQEDAQVASGTEWMMPVIAPLLLDPYDAVRFNAGRALGSLRPPLGAAYDYVAPEADRRRILESALAEWRTASTDLAPNPAVLSVGGGEFDVKAFQDLLGTRDDRPVMLKE